jgi:uncharacterized protein (UPF0332 family)
MASEHKLYIERAQNELLLADIIFQLSAKPALQKEFHIEKSETFYSAVISHAYFSIFYAAKAYLAEKGIATKSPDEHRKTFDRFKELVEGGIIDVELLRIYEAIIIKADTLLGIFAQEKSKRGKFTYRTLPQANHAPAQESLEHARTFFRHIYNLLEK